MKGDHPVITLLGSNSGNNVGDAAILASVLDILSAELPGVEFLVPTTKPSFINKHYAGRYNVKAVDMMPWTMSVRFLGPTTLWCLARSDAALICDGIIFGKKIWNPFFNFLNMLAPLAPVARLLGCKMVCYSCGIGPFPNALSKKLARFLLNRCDLIMMRETDSKELAEAIGVTQPMELTGDAAFLNRVSPDSRADEILRELSVPTDKPLFGINVTAYFDTWLKATERVADKDQFLNHLAEGINAAARSCGFRPIVFSTHPMDEPPAAKLADLLGTKVMKNSTYLSHDMQAVMRRCELFSGMRFHSLVLASAVESPIVALIYAPKVRGYMRLLRCEDVALELATITPQVLASTLEKAWTGRSALRARQKAVVDQLKDGARHAGSLMRNLLMQERTIEVTAQPGGR